jgi:adenine-specific DNA-methyltransferase
VAKVSVLYIADDVVGPHLELLRNICEPDSRAKPHITVRFFAKLRVPHAHLVTPIDYVDLVEPDCFGFHDSSQTNRTVFVRCESEELAHIDHKPDYPASEFHITIYDGSSQWFAERLLSVLRRYPWSIRVKLPPNTTLSEISLTRRKAGHANARPPREYASLPQMIFGELTGMQLSWTLLKALNNTERLNLVDRVCSHLQHVVADTSRIAPRSQSFQTPHAVRNSQEVEVHLTPPELADSIATCAVSYLDPAEPIDFGDPAVGAGAFFGALLKEVPHGRVRSAIGIDINASQVRAAQRRWQKKGMEVLPGDYLHMDRLPPRNLVLANPPYLRHQAIPADYKNELRMRASARVGMRVSGRSGQYVYFLLLAHDWMRDGAVAAWLIPSEFMQSTYGRAVREYLSQRVQLLRIHKFGIEDPQFENAEVLPVAVFFRKTVPLAESVVSLTAGGTLERPAHSEQVAVRELGNAQRWAIPWHAPQPNAASSVRIGDLFSVTRGIATGANEFFIVERELARKMRLPDEVLRPILPKIRQLETDFIDVCPDGFPDVHPQLCLIDSSLPMAVIEKEYPALAAYLKDGANSGLLNRTLVRRRDPWYRQEWRAPAPFLCTYMGRQSATKGPIRFIWNRSEAVATNTYLMLYPSEKLMRVLSDCPQLAAKLFKSMQEASRTSIVDIARMHAGGLHKVEPKELMQATLPGLPIEIIRLAQPRLV